MTIDAIESLVRIVLTEKVFIYNDKYYRQVVGGTMGSLSTLTLANIFMWDWEQKLVEHQMNSNELYGRYVDDVILTSNDYTETLRQMLEDAEKYHRNIKFNYGIGYSVSFLGAQITNQQGNLMTSVYHKQAAEPYVVPFKSNHPRHIFKNIIRGALLRAFRYSSTLKAFNNEQRDIKLMLLYNGYPVRYIYSHFKEFFLKYSVASTSVLPMIHDENEYLLLRRHFLAESTPGEHARASVIASQIDFDAPRPLTYSLVPSKFIKRRQRANALAPSLFIIHMKNDLLITNRESIKNGLVHFTIHQY